MSRALVEVRDVHKTFHSRRDGRDHGVRALSGIDLEIHQGEIYGLVGESGSGKSTLGRVIMRLIEPDRGSVGFGWQTENSSRASLAEFRGRAQMVFQNPYGSFNPSYRIRASLEEFCRVRRVPSSGREAKIHELLDQLKLSNSLLDHLPSELSGGQLQRLSILRALISSPVFLLCDEAVSALDVSVQAQILNILLELRETLRLTILFISHDLSVVQHVSDRVGVLYLGKIVEEAPAREFFAAPKHPYSKALLASCPRIGQEARVLEGEIPAFVDNHEGCPFQPRCATGRHRLECASTIPNLEPHGTSARVACLFPEHAR